MQGFVVLHSSSTWPAIDGGHSTLRSSILSPLLYRGVPCGQSHVLAQHLTPKGIDGPVSLEEAEEHFINMLCIDLKEKFSPASYENGSLRTKGDVGGLCVLPGLHLLSQPREKSV